VLGAVVGLSIEPDGFTLAQVAQEVRERTGWSDRKYSTRSAAHDLAKLRGKKLLHRAKHSRRYVADPTNPSICRQTPGNLDTRSPPRLHSHLTSVRQYGAYSVACR